MKKVFICNLMTVLCSPAVFAAQQTLTGRISDSMCGADHTMMQKGAMKMSDKDCAAACIKSGEKYVLVSNGKVYKIENQAAAGLQASAGDAVTVTGDVSADGTSIIVARIAAAKK